MGDPGPWRMIEFLDIIETLVGGMHLDRARWSSWRAGICGHVKQQMNDALTPLTSLRLSRDQSRTADGDRAGPVWQVSAKPQAASRVAWRHAVWVAMAHRSIRILSTSARRVSRPSHDDPRSGVATPPARDFNLDGALVCRQDSRCVPTTGLTIRSRGAVGARQGRTL